VAVLAAAISVPAVGQPAPGAAGRAELLGKLKLAATPTREKPRALVDVAAAPVGPIRTGPRPGGHARPAREVELPLKLPPETLGRLRAYSLKADGGLSEVPDAIKQKGGGSTISLPKDQTIVVAPDPSNLGVVPVARLGEEKSSFPGVMLKASDAPDGHTVLSKLELVMQAASTPMRWLAERHAYHCELLIGVDGSDGPTPLDRPIVVQFGGDNVVVDPPRVQIGRAGTAGYKRVNLYTDAHTAQPRVKAYSDLGPLVHEVDVGARLDKLVVLPGAARILAFGLETTTLTVAGYAEDGLDLRSPTPLQVFLSASAGRLDRLVVPLADGPQPEVKLSSSSGMLGAVEVVARESQVTSAPVRIEFAFPWILLATVIVAGATGGVLAYLRRVRRGAGARRTLILEGAIVGPVLVLAVIAGVPLVGLGGLVQNDVGRFTIAVVFGMMGTPAMALLRRAVVRTPDREPARAPAPKADAEEVARPQPPSGRAL
jgi:hypothetical protein